MLKSNKKEAKDSKKKSKNLLKNSLGKETKKPRNMSKQKPSKEKKKTGKKVSKKKEPIRRNASKTMPYRDTAILGRAYTMCLRGSSIKELTKLATKEGSKVAWLLRAMRSGERYGWTWSVKEDGGKLKIYNVRKP